MNRPEDSIDRVVRTAAFAQIGQSGFHRFELFIALCEKSLLQFIHPRHGTEPLKQHQPVTLRPSPEPEHDKQQEWHRVFALTNTDASPRRARTRPAACRRSARILRPAPVLW